MISGSRNSPIQQNNIKIPTLTYIEIFHSCNYKLLPNRENFAATSRLR